MNYVSESTHSEGEAVTLLETSWFLTNLINRSTGAREQFFANNRRGVKKTLTEPGVSEGDVVVHVYKHVRLLPKRQNRCIAVGLPRDLRNQIREAMRNLPDSAHASGLSLHSKEKTFQGNPKDFRENTH
jgi:hypothetical protein